MRANYRLQCQLYHKGNHDCAKSITAEPVRADLNPRSSIPAGGGGNMRRSKTWALVMNGERARILRGLEDGDGEDPVELVSRARSAHLRDIMADKAGRSFSSGSTGRRSAVEMGSDPILRDMQDFASETADVLEKHRQAGDFARLAIFAESKMLGILRKECPATLWTTVFLDLPLNLIALSERDIRSRVLDEIRNHE